jgi:hypothetical protein
MTLVWRPGFQFDADASTHIEAVEAADEAASPGIGALETGVRYAINDFVIDCKNDGIWSAIKASCILAGARTLAGALIPLAGTAPTKNGTEGGWNYNRKTGLKGNGTDNYLDSNRGADADPASNLHASVFVNQAISLTNTSYYGVRTIVSGATRNGFILVTSGASLLSSVRSGYTTIGPSSATGFIGNGRNSSTVEQARISGATTLYNTTELNVGSLNTFVLAQNTFGSASAFADGRISFYSIGESLDLAKLDTRVSALITAIGAAIP